MNRIIPGILVQDPAAAATFYVRHLGAKIVFDAGWHISLRLGGFNGPELSFSHPPETAVGELPRGLVSIYVEVEDVDRAHSEVRASGLDVEPPTDKPWGDRSFSFDDPIGLRLYLFSPRPMSPEFAAFQRS